MRSLTRLEQVVPGVGAHRPVVVLAGAVDAGERLLVQQADEPVAARHVLHHLHRQLLVVAAHVRVLEHRRHLVLRRRDLVVTRLDRHAELGELLLGLEHAREYALGDRPEVVVVELVPLGRLGAEERAPGGDEVRALEVEALVDQEVLLLGADGREHTRRRLVAEQLQRAQRAAGQRIHRAQERDLVVERLTRPRSERGRDAEHRAVRVLEDERGRRGVPRRVAARLERGPDAAGGERRRVGLALDQLLARELGDRVAVAGRGVERVVLLGGHAGQRLEPVREVRGAALHRPFLHGGGDGVGERGLEQLAGLERLLKLLVHRLRQPLALDGGREHVLAEDVGAGLGQVRLAERAPVGAPLGGVDVGRARSLGHGFRASSSGTGPGSRPG